MMRRFESYRLQKIPKGNHSKPFFHAAMAEWFKAMDSRPIIYDAWVRTPLAAKIKIKIKIKTKTKIKIPANS